MQSSIGPDWYRSANFHPILVFLFLNKFLNDILLSAAEVSPTKKPAVLDPAFENTDSSGTPAEITVEGRTCIILILNHV